MVTLLVGLLNANQVQEILGIILSAIEILIIITRILASIFPKDSPIGRFLSKLLRGLYDGASEVTTIIDEEDDHDDSIE